MCSDCCGKTHLDCGLHLLVAAQVKRVWQEQDHCLHWPSFLPIVDMPRFLPMTIPSPITRARFSTFSLWTRDHLLSRNLLRFSCWLGPLRLLLCGPAGCSHPAKWEITLVGLPPSLKDQANNQTLGCHM